MMFRIWRNAMKLKRFTITAFTVIKYVGVALGFEIIFLVIWTAVDRPRAHFVNISSDEVQNRCKSDTRIFWAIFLALKGVWLLFGAVIAIITRNVLKQYSEFSSIVYAVYNNIILMATAIPLALLLWDIPNGTLVITVIVIVLAFTFTICILFFDTWTQILLPQYTGIPLSTIPSTPSPDYSKSSSAHVTSAHETHEEAAEQVVN
eukprot:Phypoly_transcript_06359.p2 GENE.Phypoly_transcript_06359~~Phypoly_transcript_06359.p2  ORF type:complete len:205 (+),score=19.72 Phypoly_transcript_06359:1163-1777(+)